MTAPSSRRSERERAIGLLYEAEAKGVSPSEVAGHVGGYAHEVVSGLATDQDQIDILIGEFARGWALDRMPATDRAVLRLAAWELLRRRDVPTAVVISEAVELAKRYSTDESGRFVNGVLSAIAAELRASGD